MGIGTYSELLAQGHDFHVLLHRDAEDEADAEELDAIEEEGEELRRGSAGEPLRKNSQEDGVLADGKLEKEALEEYGKYDFMDSTKKEALEEYGMYSYMDSTKTQHAQAYPLHQNLSSGEVEHVHIRISMYEVIFSQVVFTSCLHNII